MRLLGIDPGAEWTGLGLLDVIRPGGQGPLRIKSGYAQLGPTEHHSRLEAEMHLLGPFDVVITERFEHRNDEFARLASLEYIGVVKAVCYRHRVPLVLQGASEAKAFATNDKLEKLGLLKRPVTRWKHANDGMRHVVYHLLASTRARLVPRELRHELLLKLKPLPLRKRRPGVAG